MGKIIDITGRTFGRWFVIRLSAQQLYRRSATWDCRCSCGNEKPVLGNSLKSGTSLSCGCLSAELSATRFHKHGQSQQRSSSYESWRAMISRCYSAGNVRFKDYGGRGISVCEHWRGEHGFENFLADIGERPQGKTLDRFPNNDGNYVPTNCRWATPVEQQANQRRKKCAA